MTVLTDKRPGSVPDAYPNAMAFCPTMPLMDSKEVARRLRIMRASLGLNQDEFGALINRRRQTVSNWESGGTPRDDFVLAELAARCGFSRTYFVDEEIQIPSPEESAEWQREYRRFVVNAAPRAAGVARKAAAESKAEATSRSRARQEPKGSL